MLRTGPPLSGAVRRVYAWWVPPLLCLLVGAGMFVSSPTYSAPDTTIHLATAWYDVHHGFPSESRLGNPDSSTSPHPCYAYYPEATVNTCKTLRWVTEITAPTQAIANYPPPYYWLLGAAELAMSPVRQSLEGDAARAAGLLACILLLTAAAWLLHRAKERTAIWSIYLLTPPIAIFLFAGANPNGWEIACALFFTSVLLFRRSAIVSGDVGGRETLSIALAGLLLATSRPTSGVWVVIIMAGFIIWFRVWRIRRSLCLLVAAALPSLLFTLVWESVFAIHGKVGKGTALTLHSYLFQLAASWQDLSQKAVQLWAVLGWLDTRPSGVATVGVMLVLLYFLPTYAPTRSHRALVIAIVAVVVAVSAAIEAVGWNTVGNSSVHSWWQGRYSLPILLGLSMLLFSDPGRRERPGLFALAAWVSVADAYVVCLNFWRYNYGISNGIPYQLSKPAFGPTHSIIVYLIVLLLLGAGAILFAANRAERETALDHLTLEPSEFRVSELDEHVPVGVHDSRD